MTRFVGLFTAEAYDKAASEVPLIRRKVRNALERAGKAPTERRSRAEVAAKSGRKGRNKSARAA